MKMMVGDSLRAREKMAEAILSLSPSHLSMMLDALTLIKVAWASLANALAIIVLNDYGDDN